MKRFLTVCLLALAIGSCKKDSNEGPSAANMDFTSIQKYDVNANYLGSVGNISDEYTQEEWPGWVMDLFSPLDSVSLVGYNKGEVSIKALYPNPCADTQAMRLFGAQPLNMKVVVIDNQKNVYLRKSMHVFLGEQFKSFDYSNLMMPAGYYRMFYSFSAEGAPHFRKGHIDFLKGN